MDLLGFIGWVGESIGSQIAAVVQWATAGFGTLFDDITAVNSLFGGLRDWAYNTFASLFKFLDSLWTWLRDRILQRIIDLIQRIRDWLKKYLDPLLKIIDKYRRLLRDLWQTYVKPIYDFLQRVRRVLVIFRLLGFKWAKKLDERIVKLETALTDAFFAVYSNLNVLADWINYIIDPFGVFQPSIWLGSITQSVGAIIGVIFGKMHDPGFTLPGGGYSVGSGYLTGANEKARNQMRLAGVAPPEEEQLITSLRATAARLGYTS